MPKSVCRYEYILIVNPFQFLIRFKKFFSIHRQAKNHKLKLIYLYPKVNIIGDISNLGETLFAVHRPILSIYRTDLTRHQRNTLKVSGIQFDVTFTEHGYISFCLFKSSLMLYLMSLTTIPLLFSLHMPCQIFYQNTIYHL